jgi:hypothetical protein
MKGEEAEAECVVGVICALNRYSMAAFEVNVAFDSEDDFVLGR